jgi:hypothetical protein
MRHGHFSDAENATLERMADDNASVAEMAAALGRDYGSVASRAAKLGLSPRSERSPVTMLEQQRMCALARIGLPSAVIASLSGRKRSIVDHVRERCGARPPPVPHRLCFSVTSHAHAALSASGRRHGVTVVSVAKSCIELLTRDRAELAARVLAPAAAAAKQAPLSSLQPQLAARVA